MGHPAYEITEGEILFDGESILELGADERAQRGLFLAFQYPHAIPGVTVTSFLRSAINAMRKAANGGEDDPVPIPEFRTELLAAMEQLKVPRELAPRYLNDGFSGGEKKRVEILQMAMLKPRIAMLDETDSGLDIDALRIVASGVNTLVGPEMGALVITHYQRILNYVTPDSSTSSSTGVSSPRAAPSSPTSSRPRATRRSSPQASEEARLMSTARDRRRPRNPLRLQVRVLEPRRGEGLLLQVGARPLARGRRGDLASTRTSPRGCASSATSRSTTSTPARMPDLGRQPRGDRLRQHLLLHQADREAGRHVGGPPGRDQRHLGQARHPRGGEEVPRRRRRPVRVRGRLPQAPGRSRGEGRDLPRHGLGAARARGHRQAVLRARSSRRTTTSSPRSTRRSGRAARSSTCRPASRSRCRCRPTSASTRRTWASSSGR